MPICYPPEHQHVMVIREYASSLIPLSSTLKSFLFVLNTKTSLFLRAILNLFLTHLIPNHEFKPETPRDSSNRTDYTLCSYKVINLFIS